MRNTTTQHKNFSGVPFEYNGHILKPVASIQKTFEDKAKMISLPREEIIIDNFVHADFYLVAAENGCQFVDIFEIDGKNYMAVNYGFVKVNYPCVEA